MVSLTFYGGANEIGGNKILLEDNGAKIYLDFGQSFDFGEDYFYEFLKRRTANGLEVFFEFDLLPQVPRLYSDENLHFTHLKYEKPDVDAIFISHSHSDHVGHLNFLDPSIPIYMGHCADRIIKAYHKLYPGLSNVGEHTNLKLFKSGDIIKVKHLSIEPIHVEHSVPGAYGFIIHTSKGPLIYTGDFRLHGPKGSMSKEFIQKAAQSKPLAMLCEGTRMGSEQEHNFTEEEVETESSKIIKNCQGPVFASFAMSNVDRVNSFYRAAVKNKRKLVIDTKFAYILDQLQDKVDLPDPRTDPHLKVYYRLAKSRKDGTVGFDKMSYAPWEREYMHQMVTYEDIAKKGADYVMHIGFYKLIEMVYIQPKNAQFIYSMSEHFLEGEDNEEERTVLENWLKHFGIPPVHKIHSSGHASKTDLIEAIQTVNPKILIPVHTDKKHVHEFSKIHSNVMFPQKGKTIEL